MGAFAIILLPIILFIFYGGNAILVTNLDGILSRTFHNKHKKPLVILHIALLGFSLFHIILQLLKVAVVSKVMINIIIAVMFPIWLFNIFIFSKMHQRPVEKLKIHNIIFALVGLLMFGYIIGLVDSVLIDGFKNEIENYKYYYGKKTTLVDYTLDDGTNSERVYKKLKKRLEKDDSDINEKSDKYDCYAINSVCEKYSTVTYKKLKLLIEHGADVNVQDSDGRTPIYILCCSQRINEEFDVDSWLKSVDLLLKNGADLTIEDMYHQSIFEEINQECKSLEYSNVKEQEPKLRAMKKLKNLLIEYGYEEEFEETVE